jgi:cytochrome c oxidase subunit III
MPEFSAPDAHAEFQYESPTHEAETAISGMWLFLATEILFFGGLFLVWMVYRHAHPAGFALAAEHTEITIGSINTVLLVTSSFAFSLGLYHAEQGDNRRVMQAALVTAAIGIAFLLLKAWEWHDDFDEHLFPGRDFALNGHADAGGAKLFYVFYFIGTGLHGVHMLVGIALVLLVAWRARRGAYSRSHHTGVEVVGLYWSFVDLIWMILYPLIYLAGR